MLTTPPVWADTGFDVDRVPCSAHLSNFVIDYKMLNPHWLDDEHPLTKSYKLKERSHTVFLRVENEPAAELNKYHLPLFIIVLMACVCFVLVSVKCRQQAKLCLF